MYYVIQVAPGMEEKTEMLIRKKVRAELYEKCFYPLRHVRKKFHGEWKDRHEKLLPGYVFIVSNSVQELYLELQRVPMLTKLLGKDGELFAALYREEVNWLEQLMGGAGDRGSEAGLSQVEVEEGKIIVLSGPLKNVEGSIKKINLHKRIAEIEVEFMKRKTKIHLGIEIVKKGCG
ncbi:transcription termination/antitermination protein NusG [Lachnospiraceae bacterium]|nr:transcription termination/antitermination protein NusG [Lachnospiraceae bacterium]